MIIYCTTNIINSTKYIGYDTNNNPKYLGSGTAFRRSLKKYGRKNFKKQILEYCDNFENLLEAEIYWIDYFNADKSDQFYNIRPGGGGGLHNHPNRAEIIARYSKPVLCYNLDGIFLHKYASGQETSRLLKLDHSGVFQCLIDKTKRYKKYIFRPFIEGQEIPLNIEPYKLSLIGKKRGKSTIDKISKANTGQKRSKEVCEKFRDVRLALNLKHSDETKKLMSKSAKGKIKTKEHIRKFSEAQMMPVLQFDLNDHLIQEHQSLRHVAEFLGVTRSSVCSHLKGHSQTCKGFKLKYKFVEKQRKLKINGNR